MRQHGRVEPTLRYVHTPLVTVAAETERYVAGAGWDQPARLFALVRTASLLAAEPTLVDQLASGAEPVDEDALSAIEQDGVPQTSSLEDLLAQLAWPAEVDGVAIAVERLVVPPDAEENLPADPREAADVLTAHPDRRDVRLLVAVLRDGDATCLLRQRDHDDDDKVAVDPNMAPGLVEALAATLVD
jgi:sulfur carrier protein ThiS